MSDVPDASDRPVPQGGATPVVRRSRRLGCGIGLGALGALLLGGYLLVRAWMPGTTVTVTHVGDRPLEGIVLMAVEEGSGHVRREWPIGTLRPGESHDRPHVPNDGEGRCVRRTWQRGPQPGPEPRSEGRKLEVAGAA